MSPDDMSYDAILEPKSSLCQTVLREGCQGLRNPCPRKVDAFPTVDEPSYLAGRITLEYFSGAGLAGYEEDVANFALQDGWSASRTLAYEVVTVPPNAIDEIARRVLTRVQIKLRGCQGYAWGIVKHGVSVHHLKLPV